MSRPANANRAAGTAAQAGVTLEMLKPPRTQLTRAGIMLPATLGVLAYLIAAAYVGGFFDLPVEAVGLMMVAGPPIAAIAIFASWRGRLAARKRAVLSRGLLAPGRIEALEAQHLQRSGFIDLVASATGRAAYLGALNVTLRYSFTLPGRDSRHGAAVISTREARMRREGEDCIVVYDPQAPERNFLVMPQGPTP